jgi:hypothetical protein
MRCSLGEYCGQAARELHLPFTSWLWDMLDHVFGLDTRLLWTLRPFRFRPETIARDYLGGRRVSRVPPPRAYPLAALIFSACSRSFRAGCRCWSTTTGSAEAADCVSSEMAIK